MNRSRWAAPSTAFRFGAAVLLVIAFLAQSSWAGAAGRADREPEASLRGMLDGWRVRAGIVGATIAVAVEDGPVWQAASGFSDRDSRSRLEPGAPFRVASITKTFVATVVLQLAQGGQLALDDPLAKYVPDAPHADGVEIRHLLGHTSGIPDPSQTYGFGAEPLLKDRGKRWSRAEILGLVKKQERNFSPGSKYSYSNTNYLLLGDVIEAATGSGWVEEVRKRIIVPLGLRSTYVSGAPGEAGSPAETGALVSGYYDVDDDTVAENLNIGPWTSFDSIQGPAGAMVSSAPDLVRFGSALFEGRLLSKPALAKMMSPRYDGRYNGYGLGLEFKKPDFRNIVWAHTGAMPGFAASLVYLPKEKAVVAILANDGRSGPFHLTEVVQRKVFGRSVLPDPKPGILQRFLQIVS